MQTKVVLVCVVLLLPTVGSVSRRFLPPEVNFRPNRHKILDSATADLDLRLNRAKALFDSGSFLRAADLNSQGSRDARRQGNTVYAIRFLNNLGSCQFAISRYRHALAAYLEARDLSRQSGDWEMYGALSVNLSSLYLQLGESGAAAEAASAGLEALRRAPASRHRAHLFTQLARVKAVEGQPQAADELFGQAIAEADRRSDAAVRAQACNLLGFERLRNGRLAQAEAPLLEAFRLRALAHDRDLDQSYRTLGLLRLAQGDARSSAVLLDAAVRASIAKPGKAPRWSAYYYRGQARLAQAQLSLALEDFRTALELARRWRLEVVPADAVRVSMEVELARLYGSFIQTAARLYRQSHQAVLVRDGFEAAEENRAASLRAAITDRGEMENRLPPEYGETLARLRTAEAALLRHDEPAGRATAAALRYALMEMEARAGLAGQSPGAGVGCQEWPRPGACAGRSLLGRLQRMLGSRQLLLSFHLDEPESFLWSVTHSQVGLHILPSRRQLAQQAASFSTAVREGAPAAEALGRSMCSVLFSGLGRQASDKPEWLLALDDALFQVPFAALVCGGSTGSPVYLVERHSLAVTPSAHLLAGTPWSGATGTGFVGLADPIYNTADPRWQGVRSSGGSLHLPRLAASGTEIRSCAAAWGLCPRPVLLEGAGANRGRLASALAAQPAIVHLATHVLASPARPSQGGMIALSLLGSGEPDFLGAADIADCRTSAGLVVLSGCASGLAQVLPGTGLMGLTRAWLAAGARAVAASLWATPDDTGELFRAFYTHLRERAGPRPEIALARAQRDMLRSRSFRSLPKYWAAYFIVGRK